MGCLDGTNDVFMLERKLHTKVMQEVHDVPMAKCHGENTSTITSKSFYWPKMKEDIE
jgi:hypothetical protein